MSDFYQILKREIEPKQPEAEMPDIKSSSVGSSKVVENSEKKSALFALKKTSRKIKSKKIKKVAGKKKIKKEKTFPATDAAAPHGNLDSFLSRLAANPIYLGLSEAAKLGGIQKRTVKRAVRSGFVKYRIVEKRYQVDFRSFLTYLRSKKKLWNKLQEFGLGQYVETFK